MLVREIMEPEVVAVSPEQDIVSVSGRMAERDIGCVPVVENGRVEGILTDRDIVLRCVAEGRDPMLCTAGEICTRAAAYVYADQSVEDALAVMAAEQVRRLPVLDRGKLAGMISIGDVAKKRRNKTEVGSALAEISDSYFFS